MQEPLMCLKILLPFRVFLEREGVSRIVAETPSGSFGILPRRLDCTATVVPGIFLYESRDEGERFVAIDEGVLVKTGFDVTLAVRNAIGSAGLGELQQTVEREFLKLDETEKAVRSALAKLESSFVRRFMEIHREQSP
jgi:F-type H+-transporting ATPase subunit epsilon